jgi:Integrase core domain
VATATAVVKVFRGAVRRWGLPGAVLTDNGCVYTAWHRGGATAMEVELLGLGIEFRQSRPYHPQTCGKVERFHQALKRYLARQPRARSIPELQRQVDRFVAYYNDVRPHRAVRRKTPRAVWETRDKGRFRFQSNHQRGYFWRNRIMSRGPNTSRPPAPTLVATTTPLAGSYW